MRNLSPTLLAAQQSPEHIPYVSLRASNTVNGLVKLEWDRLYTGSEEDGHHAATMSSDGSLIRVRITSGADSSKLYRQRVVNPGPLSDFSNWTYTGEYNCLVVAAAAHDSEVSVFWINTSRQIRRIKSNDNGATWGSPETIDYSATTAVNGLAAAYKPDGDLAVFFADQSVLYVKKYISGSWQPRTAWDKTTGDLSGVAVIYDGDWCLLVTGASAYGDFKVWWLLHGDGSWLPVGGWSALNEMASAPADGNFIYSAPFLHKPDVYRCFYIEQFSGIEAYSRPFWSHSIPGSSFVDTLWREAVPFNLSSEYGLAMASYGTFCWLSTPYAVWRASLDITYLDLTTDILAIKSVINRDWGQLSVELRNDDGRYSSLPSLLSPGNCLEIGLGYITPVGSEVSHGQAFMLEACKYTSSQGKASLWLEAYDGWSVMSLWTARYQIRWNKDSSEMSIKDILAFVLARVGLRLELRSASDIIATYSPDFTIHPGDRGDSIVSKLLSFVPDVLLIEGGIAYLVNPQSSDSPTYSYGLIHSILYGQYHITAPGINRVQVEGYDPSSAQPIIGESLQWNGVAASYDRLATVHDRNLDTLSRVIERGETYLRRTEIALVGGEVIVPANCGQQLYDVVEVNDARAMLNTFRRRITRLNFVFEPYNSRYEHQLMLGPV